MKPPTICEGAGQDVILDVDGKVRCRGCGRSFYPRPESITMEKIDFSDYGARYTAMTETGRRLGEVPSHEGDK